MNVTVGYLVMKGLMLSSVGPHVALLQNFGVAKMTTSGLCAASAWSIDIW